VKTVVALIGNPNCGKSMLFRSLTGVEQAVGNRPGVTVEKKCGVLKGCPNVQIVDLPGVYSLSSYSPEEKVTSDFLLKTPPDIIVNVVDGTNLERNLYLTSQLLDLALPLVVAVNKMDLVQKRNGRIDVTLLSDTLNCPVLGVSAAKERGLEALMSSALAEAKRKRFPCDIIFPPRLLREIKRIEFSLKGKIPVEKQRWYAIRFLEGDPSVLEEVQLPPSVVKAIENEVQRMKTDSRIDPESNVTAFRYQFASSMVHKMFKKQETKKESLSERIDRVVLNRFLAFPVFILVMFSVYAFAMGPFPFSLGTVCSRYITGFLQGEWLNLGMTKLLTAFKVSPWVMRLLREGVFSAIGSVLGFLPQIVVLFASLSCLEEIGYLSRVAFMMDGIFRKFGMSGKSVIPMLLSCGCGVSGVMATRVIERESSRKITVMTATFLPCSAKMPMIALFAGVVFGNSPYVALSAFILGLLSVMTAGLILKKFNRLHSPSTPFIMELPDYRLPSFSHVWSSAKSRGRDFLDRIFTVVFFSSILLWFLQNYGYVEGSLAEAQSCESSLLAKIGGFFSRIFLPLGWKGEMAWKATVATFAGMFAKEEIVATLGTIYRVSAEETRFTEEVWRAFAQDFGTFPACSFLIFNLLCAPCLAAITSIHREFQEMKWTLGTVLFMCIFAYSVSFIGYQLVGLIFGAVPFGGYTVAAVILLIILLYFLIRKRGGSHEFFD